MNIAIIPCRRPTYKRSGCMVFYWYIELLNIFCEKTPLSRVFWTNICSVACLFILSSGFFDKQKFISCDPVYQFFSLLLLLLIPCLENSCDKVIKIFCYVYIYIYIYINIIDLTHTFRFINHPRCFLL